jgi:PilZ domain-containing protein
LTKEISKFDQKSRRLRERMRLALPARILVRESVDNEWTAMTRLVDVTPFGARFPLPRPIDIGRLLQLTAAMPRQLRIFDHVEDQYRVWAIVRNIKLLEQTTPKDPLVEVGVAFIGKRPPQSYPDNPEWRYEIAQNKLESAMWAARENSVDQLTEVSTDDKRRESRQMIPVDVVIDVFEADKLVKNEHTVTENISPSGAAVFTAMDIGPGTFVKVTSQTYKTTVLAVVRARRIGRDGMTRLHLEFLGSEWPL